MLFISIAYRETTNYRTLYFTFWCRYEAPFVQSIVEKVLKNLDQKMFHVPPHFIGRDPLVQDINSCVVTHFWVPTKNKNLNSLEKTLDERLKNFGVKEMQFEERVNEIELKEQQLRLMQQSVEKYREEVELKEQQLGNILNL